LTRGNLSTHLKKLEQARLVFIDKRFVDAKPTTIISLTEFGRKQTLDYARNLSSILLTSLEEQPS
jgi:DNA-binding MarR family transcriptional regulator